MEIVGIVIGLIMFIRYFLIKKKMRKDTGYIEPYAENPLLINFLIAYIGFWIFLIFGILYLTRNNILPFSFNFLVGAFLGIFPGIFGLGFWGLSDDIYKKKPALGEPIGGLAIGCFSIFFSIITGILLGIFID